eukprot:CAMPEP_0119508928 /NCGR_PEP_ID=MMETSP1344-20130328/28387_1 /TAXON_ID=236787 /ORGANISM="Florenciella parvula, Strain CCMP2471" /LENGTH=37 /DNA_ID= /DNA_START= /DNA_END= /DNA_ORIENTATION=
MTSAIARGAPAAGGSLTVDGETGLGRGMAPGLGGAFA